MSKIVIVPDSFKGTMSSSQICRITENVIKKHLPGCETVCIPVADGGEGSVDCLLAACGGKRVEMTVKGPFFEDTESFYGILPDGKTAVIEMAAAAGLPLAGERRSAADTTTYGVGQLIADAADRGCERMILCLGGSATNDGGCGAAAALGVRFTLSGQAQYLCPDGSPIPTGRTLGSLKDIDMSGVSEQVRRIGFTAMCDIDNPLYGPTGAAYVFAPQKGVKDGELEMLDEGLQNFAAVVKDSLGKDISALPGAGAAGGMGGGSVAFLGSVLRMGIEAVLDTVNFEEKIKGADLIITGEGKLDTQSLRGKVVIGVARRAKKAGIPVAAVVGDIGDNCSAAYDMGVSGIFSTNRVAVQFSEAKKRAESDLELTVDNLIRYTFIR